ncbi:DMT family transporter [Serratia proteamaculans]|uniref:EamA-like transporter family protein n=1 Tax=Serratia proteamaculans TaxID=28151 RepID=A0A5Q2VDV9_SERPR|nr:DMT family transporter [Serratia proteamaculans]QGH62175.1 EamA-like transporter family protein [Serratia proteamaculans]
MTIIMIMLSIVGGAMLSIQTAINGQLGSKVGVFKSAFLTFSIGALVTGLLIFFFESKHALTLMDVPKWQLLGAMFGVPYIVIMVLAVQRIGAAVATVAVIFGQLTMSMLIDNFGWLGNESIPFSMSRLGAIVCLGIALFFIYSSSKPKVSPSQRAAIASREVLNLKNSKETR